MTDPTMPPYPPHQRKKVWSDDRTYIIVCERDGLDWPCPAAILGPPPEQRLSDDPAHTDGAS